MLESQGVLHRVIADVWVPRGACTPPVARAEAAASLLNHVLRAHGTLCGETAAWVHLGGRAPARVHVTTDGLFRRPNLSEPTLWQIHQVPLPRQAHTRVGTVSVTTLERTMEDLFLGVGVSGCSVALDAVKQTHEDEPMRRRRHLLHVLLERTGMNTTDLAHRVAARSVRSEHRLPQRAQRAEETLSYVSRRLPTVR